MIRLRSVCLSALLLVAVAFLASCDDVPRDFDGPWIVRSTRSEVRTTCIVPPIEDDPFQNPTRRIRIDRIGGRLNWTEVEGIFGNQPMDGEIDPDTDEFEVIHRVDNPDRGLPFVERIQGRFLSTERFESESSRTSMGSRTCSTVWEDVGVRP